jgi:hypothetical protein
MKCIKAVIANNNYKVGTILRTDNQTALERVYGGQWVFVPKSEWKLEVRGEVIPQETPTEKKGKKKKSKKNMVEPL